MEKTSVLQSFALDKDGGVRSVDEVGRGLACECVCPACGERVLARQGEVREWHFAHASGADCAAGAESALHLAAKQVLLESGGMVLPAISVYESMTLPDGRTGCGTASRNEVWVDFSSVQVEQPVGTIKPDVVAVLGRTMLFVEIAVTHFIDADKQAVIDQLGVPTVEVDLSEFVREKLGWDDVRNIVVDGVAQKHWRHVLDYKVLVEAAKQAALSEALAQRVPGLPPPVRATPSRTRYWIHGHMLDVIELPFGLALWSPFDASFNEWIKSLVRMLGGRYQPRFKNWLVPMDAKDRLIQELAKVAERPREFRS